MEFNFKIQFAVFGDSIVSEIRSNLSSKGMTTTGRTASAIRYEASAHRLKIYAPAHLVALESGRKPSAGGGRGELLGIIKQWIKDKGIKPTPDKDGKVITDDALAFLITRKIHREGTDLYKKYKGAAKGSGVISEVLNDRLTSDVRASLKLQYKNKIVAEVSSVLNKLKKVS